MNPTRPDWSQAPAGWNWLAQDADGRWFWYRTPPELGWAGGVWRANSRNQQLAAAGTPQPDWADSLQQRPSPVVPPSATTAQPSVNPQALAQWLIAQGAASVQQVQTHLSHLLLTPEFAYKLKKPVQLPFADFSSLAAREHFCREELRLNQRLAPNLYLDVLPVRGTATAPRLDTPSIKTASNAYQTSETSYQNNQIIDWILRMRRFDSSHEASALVRSGQLSALLVQDFAQQLADFHARIPQAAPGSDYGSASQVTQAIAAVCQTLGGLLQAHEKPTLAAITPVFETLAPLWQQRQAQGWVREGHGDLHLGNVVLQDGALTAFDCLEFSPALRWIDTLADVGFFSMDLHAQGRSSLAWQFLDRYLSASGDYAGIAVLRPYEIYRALVRAMAQRLQADDSTQALNPDYLHCAQTLAQPMQPRLLITCGPSGAGKSTVATALLAQAGAIRLRSDVERKRLHGLTALANSKAHGINIYSREASARTFEHLATQARAVLQAGYPCIVDATFLRQPERQCFANVAQGLGLPFHILHCHAPSEVLTQRVAQRQAQGQDPSEADVAVLQEQLPHYEALNPEEQTHAIDVNTAASWNAQALAQHWLQTAA